MRDHEPTVRSRELGRALARAATAKGFNGRMLASTLTWSESRVSRLLSGKRGTTIVDIAAFLAICGITGPKRDELLELAQNAYEPGWWQQYDNRLPARHLTLIEHEDAAVAVTDFQTHLVPGLLQTREYTRALMRTLPVIPEEEIDERTELRWKRQDIFDRHHPARFRFFVDEHVLTRTTGFGRRVESEQVHHLLRMAVRPHVEIRVIPDAAGIHAAHEPFKLLEFSELNPVVFIENMTSALFLERKEPVAGHRHVVADLDRIALDEGQSRAWLASLASALGGPREEHDEHAPNGEPDLAEEFVHRHE